MNFINTIKQLFTKPSAEVIAQQELDDARRELLQAQSTRELYESYVTYHQQRITRLRAFLEHQ